jgi:hypothetical protein
MDYGKLWLIAALAATLFVLGCGQASPNGASSADGSSPEAATTAFLEAVRTGDDKKAASLLTPAARQRTAEREMVVAPPGSDTASFVLRDVQHVDEGAHVASDWTDVDADGHLHTDRIVWVLRKESEGWRIAGMATKLFADRPPVVLNFEDPEDMLRQQQMAEEEIARRDAQRSAKGSKAPASSVR